MPSCWTLGEKAEGMAAKEIANRLRCRHSETNHLFHQGSADGCPPTRAAQVAFWKIMADNPQTGREAARFPPAFPGERVEGRGHRLGKCLCAYDPEGLQG